MRRFPAILPIVVTLALGACASTPEPDPLIAPIVGKTLTSTEGVTVVLGADGSVKGSFGDDGVIDGAYQMRDGKYCRTLTQPPAFAGTECQNVTITDDTVEFESPTGRTTMWTY